MTTEIIFGFSAWALAAFVGVVIWNAEWRRPSSLPPAPAPAPHGEVDAERLLADLRKGDVDQIAFAYRMTFGGQIGRFVLMHWMAQCGVGGRQGPGVSSEDRHYLAGRHDAAIQLMTTAGFDQASAALAALTETLGAPDDDRTRAQPYAATGIDPDDV